MQVAGGPHIAHIDVGVRHLEHRSGIGQDVALPGTGENDGEPGQRSRSALLDLGNLDITG